MFCPYCGKQIDDSATFCGYCGKAITAEKKEPQLKTASKTIGKTPSKKTDAYQKTRDIVQPVKREKKKHTGIIVVLVIIAVIFVAVAALAFLVFLGKIDVSRVPLVGEKLETILYSEKNQVDSHDDSEKDDETKKVNEIPFTEDAEEKRETPTIDQTTEPALEPTSEPTDKPVSEPARERNRMSYWNDSEKIVCVNDLAHTWTDTAAKPFVGAAERIGDWADCSVVVIVSDGTNDMSATDYLSDCRDQMIRSGDFTSRQMENCMMLLIDVDSHQYWLELRGDAENIYDDEICSNLLLPFLSSEEYEAGICKMLSGGKRIPIEETPGSDNDVPDAAAEKYILPNSDKEYITDSQLANLTWEECTLARNEIYARHGRKFTTIAIREYFEAQTWYYGTIDGSSFDSRQMEILNQYEIQNVQTIAAYEKRVYGGSKY